MMLQQTQVERVLPHYRRFLAAYPTPGDCAVAGQGDVVRRWSGLGYNRRALNLHGAASAVVARHGGLVPSDEGELRALPGVGAYTARAVRSFAFGEDVSAVDTNGARVLARCVAGAPLRAADAAQLGDQLVPAGRAWEFNQTVFDLGATVCTARRPVCSSCPVRLLCRWNQGGRAGADPWRSGAGSRHQSQFTGSDRQARGRLLDALRRGAVSRNALPAAAGRPDDPARAARIASALTAEGFARWSGGVLRLTE